MKRTIAILLALALMVPLAVSVSATTTLTRGGDTSGTTDVALTVASTYTVSIPDAVDLSTTDSVTVSVTNAILPANSTLNVIITSSNYTNGWYMVDKYAYSNTLPYDIKIGTEDVKSGDAILSLESGVVTSDSATLDFSFNYPNVSGVYQDTLTFKVDIDGDYVVYSAAEGLTLATNTGTGSFAPYDGTIAGESGVYVMKTTANEAWKTQVAPCLTVKSDNQSFAAVRKNLNELGYTYVYIDFCIAEGGVALFAQAVDSDTEPTKVTTNLRLNLGADGDISWQTEYGDNEQTYIAVLDSTGAPVDTYEKNVWYTARFKLQRYLDENGTVVGFCDANKVGGTIYLGEVRYE